MAKDDDDDDDGDDDGNNSRSGVAFEKVRICSRPRNPPPLMQPSCSLPCSKKSASDPFSEPDESSPHGHIRFL
jgi:hypothetical protein